jgi:hypothetical protein
MYIQYCLERQELEDIEREGCRVEREERLLQLELERRKRDLRLEEKRGEQEWDRDEERKERVENERFEREMMNLFFMQIWAITAHQGTRECMSLQRLVVNQASHWSLTSIMNNNLINT